MEVITNKSEDRSEMRRGVVKLFCAILEGDDVVSLADVPIELHKITAGEVMAEQERRNDEKCRLQATFWEKNPPSPLTTVPNIQSESELFDVLAHYHIAKAECFLVSFDGEHFDCFDEQRIKAWLPSDIEIELWSGLPGDEGQCIGDAICRAIGELASQQAALVTGAGFLRGGTVFFNVPERRICVNVTVEVSWQELSSRRRLAN